MAEQLQLRRGTEVENDAFTGAQGELTYDTTNGTLRIHDGTTQGGLMIDPVVEFQRPTAANNYTWYRKYASGWVEQGGFLENDSTDGVISFNLPIEMANTLYYRNLCLNMSDSTGSATNQGAARAAGCYDHDTTTTIYFQKQGSQKYGFWEVKGMAA